MGKTKIAIVVTILQRRFGLTVVFIIVIKICYWSVIGFFTGFRKETSRHLSASTMISDTFTAFAVSWARICTGTIYFWMARHFTNLHNEIWHIYYRES